MIVESEPSGSIVGINWSYSCFNLFTFFIERVPGTVLPVSGSTSASPGVIIPPDTFSQSEGFPGAFIRFSAVSIVTL